MAPTKKHRGRTGALSESLTRNDSRKHTPLPPRTPKAIAGPLRRALAACCDLNDAGASLSISIAYHNERGELVGVVIADRDTADLARLVMSPGVQVIGLGDEVQA